MLQRGHHLAFACQNCQTPITFSLFKIEKNPNLECSYCQKIYLFEDEILKRQLKKFENLCTQIKESEEILSHTAVGVTVGEKEVKIPFKLLLTRLSSYLDLKIDGRALTIAFRMEPLNDLN